MAAVWMTLALTTASIGFVVAQAKRKIPQVNVVVVINAPIDSAFDYIVPVDLSHIFKRHGMLPAIVRTNETEKWIKPGLTRTVFFEDGTSAKETLLTVVPSTSFSYQIENFTSSLRFLAKRIEGDWRFTALADGKIRIEWTYKVIPKNAFTAGLINLFVMKDIKGLLNNALAILKEDLERKPI